MQPFPLLWLTGLWVLLWGNLSVANVLGGLVLGTVVLLVFPLPRLVVGVTVRPWRTIRLLARFLFDVVQASIQVAWAAVGPGPVPPSSVIVVQLVGRNELFQTIVGSMVSLVPGSLVVDLDGERGLLALHFFGVGSHERLEAIRADVLALEQRVLRALATDPSGARPDLGGDR